VPLPSLALSLLLSFFPLYSFFLFLLFLFHSCSFSFQFTIFLSKKNTRSKNGLQKLTQKHPFSRKNSKYVPPNQRCQKINGQNRKTQKKHSINTFQTFCSTTIPRLQKLKLEPTKPKSKYEGTQSPSALLPAVTSLLFFDQPDSENSDRLDAPLCESCL
jgi:hypothetical protein